jgi:hypothetical protein
MRSGISSVPCGILYLPAGMEVIPVFFNYFQAVAVALLVLSFVSCCEAV